MQTSQKPKAPQLKLEQVDQVQISSGTNQVTSQNYSDYNNNNNYNNYNNNNYSSSNKYERIPLVAN